MKKLRWFAITLFLLSVVLYALDQNQIRRKTDQTIPKISMDQDEIQVSVKDPEKVWKKGITAYDEKDGDITDSLVIESVSTFLEKGRRLVSYAAFLMSCFVADHPDLVIVLTRGLGDPAVFIKRINHVF